EPRLRRFPWWAVKLMRRIVPLAGELHEIRPLWQHPLRLRNPRLLSVLGAEPHTPLDTAVEATLQALGCLPAPRLAAAH
ncbi:hypothetical protein CKY51_20295, partial [Xanthomonas maliensis]